MALPGLEFVLKLRDMLSPAMQSAVRAGDNAGTRLKHQFSSIAGSSHQMSSGISDVQSSLQQLGNNNAGAKIKREFDEATRSVNKLNGSIDNISSNSAKSGGSSFGVGSLIKGNLITQGITMLGGMAKDAMGSIVNGFMDEQKNLTGLKTFLGDAGAKEAMKNIKADAAATPFDTNSILQSNRALISAGASAAQARTDTLNLANAISAVGGGNAELSRMSANMQQIKTVGKATSMDIRQFAMTGINIYQLLADETGKSISQVKDMDVTYSLLSRSLARAAGQGGAYFGAMEAQSQTVSGRLGTLMDNVRTSAANIGAKLEPIITRLLDLAVGIAGHFSDWISNLQPVFDIINQIPDYIANIVSGTSEWSGYFDTIRSLAGVFWETLKHVAVNIWTIASGIIDWYKNSTLMKDIFWAIGKLGEGIYLIIGKISDALVWIWKNIIKPYWDAIEWIYTHVKSLLGGSNKLEVVVTDKIVPKVTPEGVVNGPGAKVIPMPATPKNGNMNGADERSDNINQGGQRNITITIGKQIEKMEIHVMNAQEGAAEIETAVREAMRRVMFSINGVAV